MAAAALLLAAAPPVAGQGGRGGIAIPSAGVGGVPRGKAMVRASLVARRLAKAVKKVQRRFDRNRQALPTVQGPDGEPGHPRQEVMDLIDGTEKDLDRAIAEVGDPGLAALRDWVAAELRRIRDQVDEPAGAGTAALTTGPRAVAVVASLGPYPLDDSRPEETIDAERSSEILSQVARVIGRLFFLSKKEDLEVRLWVGSTPAQDATFKLCLEGGTPRLATLGTPGTKARVPRGLYSYRADSGAGQVIQVIQWPAGDCLRSLRGDPRNSASEDLDLVDGSSFFCCRFEKGDCRHVDSESDCRSDPRPDRR